MLAHAAKWVFTAAFGGALVLLLGAVTAIVAGLLIVGAVVRDLQKASC